MTQPHAFTFRGMVDGDDGLRFDYLAPVHLRHASEEEVVPPCFIFKAAYIPATSMQP